jgi:hypothetical protein
MDDVIEVKRDLEQRRQRNEDRKRCEIATETAMRKLEIDWSLFQSEVAQLDCCNGDLRATRHILEQMGLPRSEIAIVLSYLPLQGGHCDCEVAWNVDMTNPEPLVSFACIDCGSDFDEWYMVEDAVWAASGLAPDGGKLCIGCLERRLGRKLKRDDFKSNLLNCKTGDWESLRLRDRLRLMHLPADFGGEPTRDDKNGDELTASGGNGRGAAHI